MEQFAGLRKGTWTEEEDKLLRSCVQKHGEGKWHLVPQRAGLNRCPKSCRLRWMNYLKPNIKRGHFTEDEVDMITRLRRLLGNRWSLIAGRLPGRTGNDVKNFWNTNLRKLTSSSENKKEQTEGTVKTHSVIKPKPGNLSTAWMRQRPLLLESNYGAKKGTTQPDQSANNNGKCTAQPAFVRTDDNDARDISTQDNVLESEKWKETWDCLLDDKNQGVCSFCGQEGKLNMNLWDAELATMTAKVGETSMDDHNFMNESPLDDNHWHSPS